MWPYVPSLRFVCSRIPFRSPDTTADAKFVTTVTVWLQTAASCNHGDCLAADCSKL